MLNPHFSPDKFRPNLIDGVIAAEHHQVYEMDEFYPPSVPECTFQLH